MTGILTDGSGAPWAACDRATSTLGRALVAAACVALAGCDAPPAFLQGGGSGGEASRAAGAENATRLVERDVEAPEVFQVTEPGLWDGRPSLGGVWVAHSDANDPERVIIRNAENGRFVIGALFRRERDNPGPAVQVSSDAAAALEMLAGDPTALNITALRREAVPQDDPAAGTPPTEQPADAEEGALPPALAEGALPPQTGDAAETAARDPIAAAGAALDAAGPAAEEDDTVFELNEAPDAGGDLDRPYLQVGIFAVEENAQNTAESLRQSGMIPTVFSQSSNGQDFWRVVVGPARSAAEQDALLAVVRDLGFADAYAVTN